MKKYLLVSAILLACTTSFAQIQKGATQLGGKFSYTNSKTRLNESTNFQALPQIALFISDKNSLGLNLGYSRQKNENSFNQSIVSNRFIVGLYSRFHKNLSEKFYFFLQPGITFNLGAQSQGVTDSYTINLIPGILYFLSDRVALEMNTSGLFYTNPNISGGLKTNTFGFDFNLTNVSLGASIYL